MQGSRSSTLPEGEGADHLVSQTQRHARKRAQDSETRSRAASEKAEEFDLKSAKRAKHGVQQHERSRRDAPLFNSQYKRRVPQIQFHPVGLAAWQAQAEDSRGCTR